MYAHTYIPLSPAVVKTDFTPLVADDTMIDEFPVSLGTDDIILAGVPAFPEPGAAMTNVCFGDADTETVLVLDAPAIDGLATLIIFVGRVRRIVVITFCCIIPYNKSTKEL